MASENPRKRSSAPAAGPAKKATRRSGADADARANARAMAREAKGVAREITREVSREIREELAKEAAKQARVAAKESAKQAREVAKDAAKHHRPVRGQAKESEAPERKSAIDRMTAKVEQMEEALEQKAAKAELLAKKAEQRADMLDRLARHLTSLDVWMREGPGARKPRFTRDEIAAAAVRIADEGGLGALSMRHLATVLDAGTMTLYHYVRTKDELLSLVNDAVMGEVVVPPEEPLPSSWREAVLMIARRSRDALRRHPWIFDIVDDPPFGPNSIRHFDQTLQAVSALDVSLSDKLDIVLAVDEYVFGYCLHERNNLEDGDGLDTEMTGYVNRLVEGGGYPQLDALIAELGIDGVWSAIFEHHRDEGRFDRNLGRLLDGIQAGIDAASS